MRGIPGEGDSHERISWRFGLLDRDGPWKVRPEQWAELVEHLRQFESMRMHEVFAQGEEPGKDYDLTDGGFPTRAANQRWQAMNLNDQDRVSRLRHGGPKRVYGLRVGNVFHVIWWDPKHEVWPSSKR
jgi:hypothetical protein